MSSLRAPNLHLIAMLFAVALFGCVRSDPSGDADTVDSEDAQPVVNSAPLRILVVDDEELGRVLKRQWETRSEAEVTIVDVAIEDVLTQTQIDADAVIYPAGYLGQFVESGFLQPISDRVVNDPRLTVRQILAFDRNRIVSWGRAVHAFSFGSPQLTLMYRADIFEKLEIPPPQSWDEYQRVAARLADRQALGELAPAEDVPWSGTVEPLAPGSAGQLLLARAASYSRSRSRYSTLFNYETMEPWIDRAPFVRALEELVAAAATSPESMLEVTPAKARRQLLGGHAAMGLTWPSHASVEDEMAKPNAATFSFAPIPGATEVFVFSDNRFKRRKSSRPLSVPLLAYSGRLGSVCAHAANARGALQMLASMSGDELSPLVAPHSQHTTVFRDSHLREPARWIDRGLGSEAASAYANVVRQSHGSSVWLFSVRIPGRKEYLSALDTAVHDAVTGAKTPAEALKIAAARWREITGQYGVESQKSAYKNSLGLQ